MKKIAVIGAGVSGLSAAYCLMENYDITLFEQNKHYGGHAKTVLVDETAQQLPVDVGFIVFNFETYPHLVKLFENLQVPIAKSCMSFGASINGGQLEYGSSTLNTLFAQRKNFCKPVYWQMLADVIKFNRVSLAYIVNNNVPDVTLAEYVKQLGLGKWFTEYFLLPMGASIWSTSVQSMMEFPAETLLRFFYNHGLLRINNPIQWYTVRGGSREYVSRLVKALQKNHVSFAGKVVQVIRDEHGVSIVDEQGQHKRFDKVIFATHSDQVLEILQNPSEQERKYLGDIGYQSNRVVLHSDVNFMPVNRRAWSSWVYLSDGNSDTKPYISLTYWMNNLQPLATDKNYFVTVNPAREPTPESIVGEYHFAHPQFNQKAMLAQKQMMALQGLQHSYFCGAYLRYGFHEDGILSAINVSKLLGVTPAL